jgi:dihydropyrimidinase
VDAGFRPRDEGGNFTLIPNGIPSVEERVKLLYTHGVKTGKIDLQTLVRVGSTAAAKIFGMYPRKGEIAVGSDADLVVWDPAYRGEISAKTHLMATDYSAWEGWPVEGRTKVVTLRGEVVVRDGKFVGTMGRGKPVERR